MRITEKTRFPHPVLSPSTGDYVSGEFSMDIQVQENRSTGSVTLEHAITLTEPNIRALIESNQATVGCFIKCGDTFFTSLRTMAWPTGVSDFKPGLLLNRVTFQPIIWLKSDTIQWDAETIHPEFAPPISLNTGEILAVGEQLVISVGQAKLKPIESIFNLIKSEKLSDGQIKIELNSNQISIQVDTKTFNSIAQLREQKNGKAILLNAIYLPAVMEVLDILRCADEYESFRWHQPFLAKCDDKGIRIDESMSIFNAAQLLLEYPGRNLGALTGE
ncbi:hypothetical protein [Pseudomonas sp. TWI628]|uniref:hypothetical protein n=1 Tax=Pseudomonas sp. TWI628 TaxID=3136788 RepID=UPI00320A3D44